MNVDIAIVGVFLLLCLVIGVKKTSSVKNITEFTVSNRNIPTSVLAITIFATHIGAGMTIGIVEKLYSLGLIFIIALSFEPMIWLISDKVFSPAIERFKHCISTSDIMELSYGKAGRWVSNYSNLLLSVGVVTVQIMAIGYLFKYFFDVSPSIGVGVGFVIIVLYSLFGGVRSVIITDVFQFIVFFIAIPLACAFAFYDIGGMSGLSALPESYLKLDVTEDNVLFFLSMVLYYMMPVPQAPFVQRFLIAKNRQQLTSALRITTMLHIAFYIIIIFTTLVIKAKNSDLDPNMAFLYFINYYLPVGMKGMMIAGMLAVIMSTADSWLNSGSVVCAHDIIKPLYPEITMSQELMIARISTVAIAAIGVAISYFEHGIMDLVWSVANFWYPLMLVPIIMCFRGLKLEQRYFILSSVVAAISTFVGRYVAGSFGTISIIIGVAGSALSLAIMPKLQEMGVLSNMKDRFDTLLREKASKHKTMYYTFGVFGVLYYVVPIFIAPMTVHLEYLLLPRGVAAILCLLLCFMDYWPNAWKKHYLPIYWYITLMFCLVSFPVYTVLISGLSTFWILNSLFSFFLLSVLLDWMSFAVLMVAGLVLGTVMKIMVGNVDLINALEVRDVQNIFLLPYLYIATMVVSFMFIRPKEIEANLRNEYIGVLKKNVEERTAHLTQALTAKDEFIAGLSHEIRTPVHGLIGLSNILKDDWDNFPDRERYRFVKMMADNGNRLMDLIGNVLDFSKFSLNKMALDMKRHNINSIAQGVVSSARALAISKKREMTIGFKASEELYAYCDKARITQVLMNLLNNAISYSDKGTKILIEAQRNDENEIVVSVKDEGIGIPQEELAMVFDFFVQGSRTKDRSKGKGIGLALCKAIIENHGGVIWAENNIDKGSTFYFTLMEKIGERNEHKE